MPVPNRLVVHDHVLFTKDQLVRIGDLACILANLLAAVQETGHELWGDKPNCLALVYHLPQVSLVLANAMHLHFTQQTQGVKFFSHQGKNFLGGSVQLLGHAEERRTVDHTGQLFSYFWVPMKELIHDHTSHRVSHKEDGQCLLHLQKQSRNIVHVSVDGVSADPGSGRVSSSVKVHQVHNVSIEGELQRRFNKGVRALREPMHDAHISSLLGDSDILNARVVVVERGIGHGLGRDILTQNVDPASKCDFSLVQSLEQMKLKVGVFYVVVPVRFVFVCLGALLELVGF